MTGTEVKKMTSEEIGVEIVRLRERLFTLRGQKTTEKVEDLSQFMKVRRDIARLMGEQSSRRVKSEPQPGRRSSASRAERTAARAPAAVKPAQKSTARVSTKTAAGGAPKSTKAKTRGRARSKAKA